MTNTTTTKAEEILKVDAIGRVRVPVERREMLVDEFEGSGMSGLAFAKRYGINYPTFATWVQKRRRADGTYEKMKVKRDACRAVGAKKNNADKNCVNNPATKVKWLEVVKEEPVAVVRGLKVELPGGGAVRVEDAKQAMLAAVLIRELQRSVVC